MNGERIHLKKTVQLLKQKNNFLGNKGYKNLSIFLNIRLLITIIIFLFSLFSLSYGYFWAPILSIIYFYGIEYLFFDLRIRKKDEKLLLEALFFFEILVISLDDQRNVIQDLKKVCNCVKGELAENVNDIINDLEYGKEKESIFDRLKQSISNKEVYLLLVNIFHALTNQTNLKESLEQQLVYLKEYRTTRFKYQVIKTYFLLFLVSIILLLPIVVILLNPSIILS